jgi:predicted nucleic acid-binding protein
MVKALFDTNILIDFLNGVPEARAEISRYRSVAISVVTWMEVRAGAPAQEDGATRDFLESFERIAIDDTIAEAAVAIRRARRIRLPDALIQATAETGAMLLVTRNERDFPAEAPGVRIPYRI